MQDNMLLNSFENHFIVSISDTQGNIVYSNDNFLKLLQKPIKQSVGQAQELLKSLLQTKELFCQVWRAILAGEKWRGILFYKGNGNKNHWLDTTISPIKNENGHIVRYVTISNDITNYYCKENHNNTIYCKEKKLIENFTKEVLYINRYGKIINTSENILNNTYNSIMGSNIYDFIHPANHGYIKEQVDKVFAKGKKCKYQSVGLSPKGNQTLYVSKIKPVFNLDNEVIYATLKSKKHKKYVNANNKLKAIETKYSNIFQSINVGILVVANSVGNIIEWNKGAELAFGYSSSEIIGEPLTILMSKKQVDVGVKELLKAKNKLDNNTYDDTIEMLGLRKNGEEFPVEFAMSHWRNGKEKFYCAFMLDISKRKKLEEKLKKTTKDLELFLYRSAHELKAPLTSAEGLLLLLKEEKQNKRVSLLINMLDETLEKGRLLLDDLAFASIISEKRRSISVIDFKSKINTTLNTLRGIKNFEDINFQVQLEQETDFFFNQELMDSVFQNLIHNAICFSKSKTKSYTPITKIKIKVSEKQVSIIVADNGLGIDSECIDKVFNLYFKTNSVNSNGAGLGLYIVKRIVDDFNGHVTVTSKINKGTSFEVILPNLKEGELNDD